MRVVVVLHKEKEEGLGKYGAKVAANAPLSLKGFLEAHELIPGLEPYGPFAAIVCSRLARTSEMVSVYALHFDVEFSSRKELGQHASKDGDEVFFYPGCEDEYYAYWQKNAVQFFKEELGALAKALGDEATILIVTHRPIVAGLLCYLKGSSDEAEMKALARGSEIFKKDFYVFEVSGDGSFVFKE